MKHLAGEFEKQKSTVLLFPFRTDIWRRQCKPICQMITDLANTIAKYQPVVLGVLPDLAETVNKKYVFEKNVTILPCLYNDCWSRDTVSSVVLGEEPYVASFGFNSYGDGLYYPWDDDDRLDEAIASFFDYPLKKCDLILEGGNIMPDGNGTIISVKDALVNDNRNPGVSAEEVEKRLKEATGAKQIIWIPRGLVNDETGGHIDNILAFADKDTAIISWTDNPDDPQYEVVREVEAIMMEARNTDGGPYRIIHLPIAPVYYRNEEDSSEITYAEGSFSRNEGMAILETYINFALVNGAVIVPQFGYEELDAEAVRILKEAFPDRDVIPFYSREASLGGGGLHCLTKHIN